MFIEQNLETFNSSYSSCRYPSLSNSLKCCSHISVILVNVCIGRLFLNYIWHFPSLFISPKENKYLRWLNIHDGSARKSNKTLISRHLKNACLACLCTVSLYVINMLAENISSTCRPHNSWSVRCSLKYCWRNFLLKI